MTTPLDAARAELERQGLRVNQRGRLWTLGQHDDWVQLDLAALIEAVLGAQWQPEAEWHEDMGEVLWCRVPVDEPPVVTTPLSSSWTDDYYTHFHVLPPPPKDPATQT